MTRANKFGNSGLLVAALGLGITHWLPLAAGVLFLISLLLTWIAGKKGSQVWWLSQLVIFAAFGLFALVVEHVH